MNSSQRLPRDADSCATSIASLALLGAMLLALGSPAMAGVIKGRVVDQNGHGVQGVDIDVETLGGADVEEISSDGTNAQGSFSTNVPDGLYVILFNPPAALQDSLLTAVIENVVVSGTVQLGKVKMFAGVPLSGRVLGPGGLPVAGVDIDVVELASGQDLVVPGDLSGADGRFEIVVPNTAVEVQFETAQLAGPTLAPTSVTVESQTSVDLGDVELTDGFTLSGTVSGPGGVPVSGADTDVFVAGTQQRMFTPQDDTDAFGAFHVILPTGTYDLRIDPPFDAGVLTGHVDAVTLSGDTNIGPIELEGGVLAVPLRLGDRFEGTLSAGDVDAVSFAATAGTKLNLTLKRMKGSSAQPAFRVVAPDDSVLLAAADSVVKPTLARVKKLLLPLSGIYRVEIETAGPGEGGYRLSTKGRFPRRFKTLLDVPDDAEFEFGALAGWTLRSAKLKAVKNKAIPEPLLPTLAFSDADAQPVSLTGLMSSNTKGTWVKLKGLELATSGDQRLLGGGALGTTGQAKLSVSLRVLKLKAELVLEP